MAFKQLWKCFTGHLHFPRLQMTEYVYTVTY